MIEQIFATPTCLELIRIADLNENLEHCIKEFEVCLKGLEAYLQDKRKKFPRFYFASNDDTLKMISDGTA